MLNISTLLRKRGLLLMAVAAMALVVACGPGGLCEPDSERLRREDQERQIQAALRSTPTPTATPTATAAATSSAAPAGSATPAPFAGKIGLGFDHPPFAPGNGSVGGNSVGIVCGVLTGVPGGAIVTINLTGGTGAPATVNGPLGADGGFTLPFPISSYGPLNATLGGVKTSAGASLTGSVPPAAPLQVAAGPDVPCAAR